ncbi:hypothetical protein GQX74_014929 [Glossina fuscipes]|nr:hypothetical protein GQX74_014929 [Glossina fuscipes]
MFKTSIKSIIIIQQFSGHIMPIDIFFTQFELKDTQKPIKKLEYGNWGDRHFPTKSIQALTKTFEIFFILQIPPSVFSIALIHSSSNHQSVDPGYRQC